MLAMDLQGLIRHPLCLHFQSKMNKTRHRFTTRRLFRVYFYLYKCGVAMNEDGGELAAKQTWGNGAVGLCFKGSTIMRDERLALSNEKGEQTLFIHSIFCLSL